MPRVVTVHQYAHVRSTYAANFQEVIIAKPKWKLITPETETARSIQDVAVANLLASTTTPHIFLNTKALVDDTPHCPPASTWK